MPASQKMKNEKARRARDHVKLGVLLIMDSSGIGG